MGILISPEINISSLNSNFDNQYFLNFCSSCFFHGIDWIYSSYTNFSFLNIKIWYFFFFNSIFDQSFDYFFFIFWFFNLIQSKLQLFNSIILDLFISSKTFNFFYSSEWFNFLFSSKHSIFIFIFHPELIIINNSINITFLSFFSDIFISLFNNTNIEVFFTPITLVPQLIFIVFFFSLFINFYFSFYTSSVNEESTIDIDFLMNSATVESEKEISSFDDIILTFLVLFYTFGWYFYIHCWSLLNFLPELVFVFYLFPLLYFIIIGIPTFLIYDFGIFFLIYLKGVGSSPILIFELLFDYIAVIIFYTRIIVQGVRLVLMLFTYISMQDLVLFFSFNQKIFLEYDSIWEEFNSFSFNFDSITYFILFSLPSRFLYWIYEILHTFFVVTVQFAAFFAIVFWLFLFLYTFFVLEKQENYFTSKRELKRLKK